MTSAISPDHGTTTREPSPGPSPNRSWSNPPGLAKSAADGAEYAARALELAGRVLAPESRGGADWRLGQLLLRESFIAAARVVAEDPSIHSLDQATAALEARRKLAPTAGRWNRILGVADQLRAEEDPRSERMLEVERAVAQLVSMAVGQRPRWPIPRWLRCAFVGGLLFIVAAVVAAPEVFRKRWEDYQWTSSSAAYGLHQTGTLDEHGAMGLLFHTAEEPQPWILIDMLERRSVSRVIVKNRYECCFDRGLPLVMEVGEDPESFVQVGRQREPFNVWTADFSAREARYVRIRSEANAAIHFRAIEIP